MVAIMLNYVCVEHFMVLTNICRRDSQMYNYVPLSRKLDGFWIGFLSILSHGNYASCCFGDID